MIQKHIGRYKKNIDDQNKNSKYLDVLNQNKYKWIFYLGTWTRYWCFVFSNLHLPWNKIKTSNDAKLAHNHTINIGNELHAI